MSDLFAAREKVEKGANWRGSINVEIDGDVHQLTVRQLFDPEQWEVMSDIDLDEIEELRGELPEEKMEELDELQDKDTLTDDEEARLEELQAEIEDEELDIFGVLSFDTYKGLKKAAKYGVEPDESDIQYALANHTNEIQDAYGGMTNEDAKKYVNDHVIDPLIEKSTNFASFAMGIEVIGETLGDTKN